MPPALRRMSTPRPLDQAPGRRRGRAHLVGTYADDVDEADGVDAEGGDEPSAQGCTRRARMRSCETVNACVCVRMVAVGR